MKSDYLKLARTGSKLAGNIANRPVVRLAILSDNATQQLTNVLKGSLLEKGFHPEIYEAEFDTIATEVLDKKSGLFAFNPVCVWLNISSQAYRNRFYNAKAEEVHQLPAAYVSEICSFVSVLVAGGCQVIVNSLAFPQERSFGNYSARTLFSLYGSILEVNRLLSEPGGAKPPYHLNDVAYIASACGLDNWHDERLWTHGKYLCAPKNFPLLTSSVTDLIKTTFGKIVKCLVLDLDNTLWGGVIGDDGLDGIEIGELGPGEAFAQFQRYLLRLKERGIILAVCSKNDEEVARQPFREHPNMVLRESDFAVFIANWNAKSGNIQEIAKVLKLGLDSLAFIDDSPFERNEIRHALPELIVPEMPEDVSHYTSFLESENLFETTSFSDDDRHRAQMYREEAQRSTLELKSADITEYLRSLDMTMVCKPFDSLHLPRVAQLIQRSNQFNLRTQRFSEARCLECMNNPAEYATWYFRLRDKFGDYGLISAICAHILAGELHILEYVMSCRVLNRGVEQFTMAELVNFCKTRGLSSIVGEYIPTKKNKMVSGLYEQFGFKLAAQNGDSSVWKLNVREFIAPTHFIKKGDE